MTPELFDNLQIRLDDPSGQMLECRSPIDGRLLGSLALTGDEDADLAVQRAVDAFRQWRGEPKPQWWDTSGGGEWGYRDIPGFCKAATTDEIKKHGFVLTPDRYVGAEEQEDDGEPFTDKYPRLLAELEEHFTEGERLTAVIRKSLSGIEHAD